MERYLGRPAAELLSVEPFKSWTHERSVDSDLPETRIDYVFAGNGMEMTCDGEDRIRTLFFHAEKLGGFDESLLGLSFSSSRQQVLERFGSPCKGGGKVSDPILGEYGAWDRFTRDGYTLHVQYRAAADSLELVTLMRSDVVPP